MSLRLKQAWRLLLRSLRVLIFGPVREPEACARIRKQIDDLLSSAVPSDYLADLRRMQRFYGIYSAVGRTLGVTPQHVRRVALGLNRSDRVLLALEAEYRRIERTAGGEA